MTTKILMAAAALALVGAGRLAAQQPAGEANYTKMCASCHGAHGTPSAGMAHMGVPDFAAAAMASVADSVLRDAIVNGKGHMMPSYKTRLTPAQVEEVVAYIKTFSKR